MWEDILKRNTKIDEIFIKKYEDNEPNYFEKNCLSLITEIAEFLNETKCFKYWSIKNPDKDKLKEEYADALIMTLLNITEEEIKDACYKKQEIVEKRLSDDNY